jgi:hypothetical protein
MFRSFATSSDMTLTLFAAVEALGFSPATSGSSSKGLQPRQLPDARF